VSTRETKFALAVIANSCRSQIVDKHTGVMNIDGELIVPMDGCDHTTVCRFENASSDGYKSILDVLVRYTAQARESQS
jgi:hypothetical protein